MTILGTRPEIIRLSRIIPALDTQCDHVLVHTGQNFDPLLSDIFLQELGIRQPDHVLECRADTAMTQVGRILVECERVMHAERPDRLLILGDTNSALSAIAAKRFGIPVFHMEAGNRCYDDRVPEEVNRRIVDHCSDVLMPYTERSGKNLIREGIESFRIHVTGNPIFEVLNYYENRVNESRVLQTMNLATGKYFLVTLHRAENVDLEIRLKQFLKAFQLIRARYDMPVVCSIHPRTRSRLAQGGLERAGDGILFAEPFGFFDFVNLERNALAVLTDSGTVQEETCIFRVPAVTLRDATERPETIDVGSTILSGAEPERILHCLHTVLERPKNWTPPWEYTVPDVSSQAVRIVLGD